MSIGHIDTDAPTQPLSQDFRMDKDKCKSNPPPHPESGGHKNNHKMINI